MTLFKTTVSGPAKNTREALIREETRFLLQSNDARFSKQLLARLLEEGCNLPLAVARPVFCRHIVFKLKAALDASGQASFSRRFQGDDERLIHPQFHGIMRFLHSRLPDAETRMAYAALDAVVAVLNTWRLDESVLTGNPETFEAVVREMVTRIKNGNPEGRLAGLRFRVVIRRVRMALTASLLRHVRDPEGFRSEFGSIPRVLKTMQSDPTVFCRVMSFLKNRLPHFDHIASRALWRTLNNLDAEQSAPLDGI